MTFPVQVSRRDFLKGASLAIGGCILHPVLSSWATTFDPSSPLVKRVVRSPDNTYFTYPHSNGFLHDGNCVLASPTSGPNNPGLDYISFDPATGKSSLITHVRDSRMYYSISDNGRMLFTRKHAVALVDLTRKNDKPRQIFSVDECFFLSGCELSADGKKALITRTCPDTPKTHRLDLIDVATGKAETIFEADWLIDHAHFSPHDPSWVVFSCGEPKRYMRMWVWHREQAPKGRKLFNQTRPDGKVFDVGHERAMFNKPAILTVAYGSNSSARPCGLYEVGFDGSVKLVSESMRDFHCNVSRDGRWAVVSLQGSYEQLNARTSGDWNNNGPGYGISDVMVVNLRTGARQFLYRATNAAKGQPYEVQPTISPDGRWVLLKDAKEQRVLCVEINQPALDAFLK